MTLLSSQPQHVMVSTLVLGLDLCGIFVFALSGATAGIKHKLDLFGVLVLSYGAANAGGLALFAVSGALKTIDLYLGPVTAVLLGMLTGIGGGIVRDMLAAEVPSVLRGDIHAVAALAGAAVVVIGRTRTTSA